MSKIYVVLIKAHTGLGSIARKIKKFEYTHVAVCFDNSFTDFYSFSRKHHFLPADSGFMIEKRDFYAFGEHKNFKTKIFEIEVPEDNYQSIKNFVEECQKDSQMMFNVFSMIFWPVEIYKSHNCMTFTAKILELSGVVQLKKDYYKMRLKDIDESLNEFVYSEGYLDRFDSDEYEEYMRYFSWGKRVLRIVKLFCLVILRMFTKK